MPPDPGVIGNVTSNQQVADAVAAVSAAHRAWLYAAVAATILSLWAALEWIFAICVVVHRDSIRRGAAKDLPLYTEAAECAFELMESCLEAWPRTQARYEVAINSYDREKDLSSLLKAKEEFQDDAEHCVQAIERYHDAERARSDIQRIANPPTDLLSEVEGEWRGVCRQAGNVERMHALVLDHWDLYRVTRTVAPSVVSEEEFRSTKNRMYELERDIEVAFEKMSEAELLREELQRLVADYEVSRVPKYYDRCLVCGRPLSDPESMIRGVGPTCWNRL
jgi:hypothetical protein